MTNRQHTMTDRQQFIRSLARRVTHLHCAGCHAAPPRFAGGLCERCELPSMGTAGQSRRNPAAASSRT
jgi:predicted amidophosphoribosyltransferase